MERETHHGLPLTHISELDWDGIEAGIYLFRGLNERELEQLIQAGLENFQVHKGTSWEPIPGENVKFWAGPGHNSGLVAEIHRSHGEFQDNGSILTQVNCLETFTTSVRLFEYSQLP